MEDLKVVNNWEAAEELEKFKQTYIDPLREKVDEALGILGDDSRKWKKGEKDRAKAKFKRIEADYINYTIFYHAVLKLIEQHEAQTDLLTEVYSHWFHNVSNKGEQPAEMMSMQAKLLQEYFQRIFEAVEPLKLSLEPTQT